MNSITEHIIAQYLDFSGEKVFVDFVKFNKEITEAKQKVAIGSREYRILDYIQRKIFHGIEACVRHDLLYVIVDEQSLQDIEDAIAEEEGNLGKAEKNPARSVAPKPLKKKKNDLGKITDEGKAPYSSRVDQYWDSREIKVVFRPDNKQLRAGVEIPKTYAYKEPEFLKQHYGLQAIEFGNWLSQRDRANYTAGLGIALFDLCKYIGFSPKQLALENRLSVAFGARGRGSAVAHFEPSTFAINITRYRRPKKGTLNTDRTKLLIASGGMGSFAHEFGHALDYFGGTFIDRSRSGALSDGRSLRVRPNKSMMKLKSLQGMMERLLDKLIWQSPGKHSTFYQRLLKNKDMTKYHLRRNELFAHAFEIYVHYKMDKYKYRNLFLAETKYDNGFYPTLAEMARLESDFDTLLKTIKAEL